jgi:uroporphyrinogen-III decarboxylase
MVGGWTARGGVESIRPQTLPESEADIDELIPLDEEPDAASMVCAGKAELAHALLQSHGDRLYATAEASSPFWSCYYIWGFEGMMIATATRPDLIRYACERLLQREIAALRCSAMLGAQGVWIEECLTDLLSPGQFAILSLPYVQRLAQAVREQGMHAIYYYCGNPVGKWDLLLESGAQALAFEEGKKGFIIDMEHVASRVDGRCVLFGNLDAIGVMQNGSRSDVKVHIGRQLEAGRRNHGRFVMSIGSPVTPQTSPARVREYCSLVRELAWEAR